MYKFIPLICMLACFWASLASTVSKVKPKYPSNDCGLEKGGPIVQQIALPNKDYRGFFWVANPGVLLSVSQASTDANAYAYATGLMFHTHIKELEGSKFVKHVPFEDDPFKFLLVTDKALYILNIDFSENKTTYTLKLYNTVFTNADHSIISALTDVAGNLYLGVSNAKEAHGSLLKFNVAANTIIKVQSSYPSYTAFASNKDHSYAYLVDSTTNVVRSFNFVEATGALTNEKVIFDMKREGKSLSGRVSCIVVDTDENLWIGLAGGGAVIQYNPTEQKILNVIGVPTNVEDVMFGGDNFDQLFVGTSQIPSEAGSGSIFAISGTGASGWQGNFVAKP